MSLATHETYHVYSLPPALLDTLVPQSIRLRPQFAVPSEANAPGDAASDSLVTADTAPPGTGGRICNVCMGTTFGDIDEQRSHFRSDWHRYNVKIRLSGGQPVDQGRFAQLVEGLEDSISGSASSSSDSDSDSDRVSTLLSRTKIIARASSRSPSPDAPGPQSALVWFHSSPKTTQIGVYKALFAPSSGDSNDAGYLHALRAAQTGHGEGRTWALFMVAGGHFAGAVARVSRSDDEVEAERLEQERERLASAEGTEEVAKRKRKPKPKPKKPETEILKHKTFHRYTTRRKQGGSQSVNDNAKSKAKSAGAQLRRYGEQALRDDIQGLLRDWADEIADCECIWIRASWSNRRMFMDENGGLFEKGDERLRTFPFPTRRPTQSELIRCLTELTRAKATHFTDAELREQDEAYLAALPKPRPRPAEHNADAAPAKSPVPALPQLTPEQQVLRTRWLRALEMVHKGRLDALRAFWAREGGALGGADARVPAWIGDGESMGGEMDEVTQRACGRTLLMVAITSNQADVIQWLLEDARADPTVDVPSTGTLADEDGDAEGQGPEESEDEGAARVAGSGRRTGYDLARTRDIRNMFRRAAGAHPDWWDWLGTGPGGGRVPSVLTQAMEEGRGEKRKARRKGLKDKIREREAKEKQKEPVGSPLAEAASLLSVKDGESSGQGPQKLGGTSVGSEGTMGLTAEMRAKVERERRARAAEARMKALGGR